MLLPPGPWVLCPPRPCTTIHAPHPRHVQEEGRQSPKVSSGQSPGCCSESSCQSKAFPSRKLPSECRSGSCPAPSSQLLAPGLGWLWLHQLFFPAIRHAAQKGLGATWGTQHGVAGEAGGGEPGPVVSRFLQYPSRILELGKNQ